MRYCILFLLTAISSFAAGPFEFGVRIGVPFTDVINAGDNPGVLANTQTQRYILGPSVEVKLPFRLSVEGDVLYERFHIQSNLLSNAGSVVSAASTATSNQWEFPILAKYRFTGGTIRPYVGAGASFRHIADIGRLSSFVQGTNPGNSVSEGFVFAGGIQFRLFVLKLSPELRFTRWGSNNIYDGFGNILKTSQNQGEFLLGITF